MLAIREIDDSPLMRAMQEIQNSPTMRAMQEFQDSPAMRTMREIQDSPVMRAIREVQDSPAMRAMREIHDSPVMRVIREVQDSPVMRVMRDMQDTPAMRAMREIQDSPVMRTLREMQERSVLAGMREPRFQAEMTSPALRVFLAQTSIASTARSQATALDNRLGWQFTAVSGLGGLAARGPAAAVLAGYDASAADDAILYRTVVRAAHGLDEGGRDVSAVFLAAIASAWEILRQKWSSNDDGIAKINAVELLTLLCAIASLWVAKVGLDLSEANASTQDVQDVEMAVAAVGREVRSLAVEQHDRDVRYRHVARPSLLRIGPSAQADVIMQIYEDQLLRVMDSDGEWVRVEVLSYRNEEPMVGWISRRRLRAGNAE